MESTPHIPDHELLRPIGKGSYGEVWLARNVTGAYRAVKIVYRSSFDHNRPYEREFSGMQKYEPVSRTHETQVAILHVGRNDTDGYFYYIMEVADDRLSGQDINPASYEPWTLRGYLFKNGRVPIDECLDIGIHLASALDHIHKNGLVHRDVKPSNIIFIKQVPKLADIGLVSATNAERSFVGTEGYIPPEGPGSPQADIYSLGKVLYEISTGRNRLDFPELPTLLKDMPERQALVQFNEVVLKACEDDPKNRYQTAGDMLADLWILKSGEPIRRILPKTAAKKFLVAVLVAGFLIASYCGIKLLSHGGLLWHGHNSARPFANMAFIPGGSFVMGDALDGEKDALPTATINVSAFYMDKNPVSYGQWQSVITWAWDHGYSFDHPGSGRATNHPVQTVDWYDCVKWCNARSQQAGLTPVYYVDPNLTQLFTNGDTDAVYPNRAANGYRLPTEAEWEKAARGGSNGKRFPWGNSISENQADYKGNTARYSYDLGPDGYNAAFTNVGTANTDPFRGIPYTSPTEYFSPNGYGLFDMAGNVLTWCWDWYGTPYGQPTTDNPTGPASGDRRVLRGGRWGYVANDSRCANRSANRLFVKPSDAYNDIGIRCVLPGAPVQASSSNWSGSASLGANDAVHSPDDTLTGPKVSTEDLKQALIGWWRADGNALDSAGTNDGTLAGSAGFAPGKYGQAFLLNARAVNNSYTPAYSDYVSVHNSPGWAFGKNDFSIELWANFSGTAYVEHQAFLASDDGPGKLNKWIFWKHNDRIEFHVNYENSGAAIYLSPPCKFDPVPGQWRHLAITRSNYVVRFYIDEAEVGAETWAGSVPAAVVPLTIGNAESDNYFHGRLQDIRIYNRALSPEEISRTVRETPAGQAGNPQSALTPANLTTTERNVTVPETQSVSAVDSKRGLISWWKADGSAVDSMNKNNGTIRGDVEFADGPFGKAFFLKGGYIEIPDSPSLRFNGPFSMSLWMKVPGYSSHLAAIITKGDHSWRLQRDFDGHSVLFSITGVNHSRFNGHPPVDLSATRIVDDNNWHHVAVVYDGTGEAIYIDGVLDISVACSGSPAVDNQPVFIGQNSQSSLRTLNGEVSDVRIYNRALSLDEIKSLATAVQPDISVSGTGPAASSPNKPSEQTVIPGVIYQTYFGPETFHSATFAGQDGWIARSGISVAAGKIIDTRRGRGLSISGSDLELEPGHDYNVNYIKLLDFNPGTTKPQHLNLSADVQFHLDPDGAKLKYFFTWVGLSLPHGSVVAEMVMRADGWLWSQTYSPNQNRDVTGSGSYLTNGWYNLNLDCDFQHHRVTYFVNGRAFAAVPINPQCDPGGASLYLKMSSPQPTPTTMVLGKLAVTSNVSPNISNGFVSPSASEWFVELDETNGFYASPGVPDSAIQTLQEAQQQDIELRSFSFIPSGGWIILDGQGAKTSDEGLSSRAKNKNDWPEHLGKSALCAAFTATGQWILIFRGGGFWGSGSSAFAKVGELLASGHQIRSVSYGPGDGNVILYATNSVSYHNIPENLARVLDSATNNSVRIDCVAFKGADWICLSRDAWWSSDPNLPAAKIIDQKFRLGLHPKWIAFVPRKSQ